MTSDSIRQMRQDLRRVFEFEESIDPRTIDAVLWFVETQVYYAERGVDDNGNPINKGEHDE